jgi:hypothetical protein
VRRRDPLSARRTCLMDKPTHYEIRIKGHLESTWADWFDGLTISNLDNGEALLSGYLLDQAALHGVLNRIASLGLTLIAVNAIPEKRSSE